jgi:hypothetical protein
MVSRSRLSEVIVATATGLEERAARRELSGSNVRIVRTGIGRGGEFDDTVISCGLCGGVRRNVPSGTVIIPNEIERPNGERITCDGELSVLLRDAARTLGEAPLDEPLCTSTALVRGAGRATLAERGFFGVDMESGLIRAPRIVAVRVILDTPEQELSDAWLQPLSVIFRPHVWHELPWLARTAPRYAALAAKIISTALTNGES